MVTRVGRPDPYFGRPWPGLDCHRPGARSVPVPLGESSADCSRPVVDGDQGVYRVVGEAAGVVAPREGAQFDHRRSLYSVAGIVLLAAALVLAMVAASMAEVA